MHYSNNVRYSWYDMPFVVVVVLVILVVQVVPVAFAALAFLVVRPRMNFAKLNSFHILPRAACIFPFTSGPTFVGELVVRLHAFPSIGHGPCHGLK